MNIHTKNPIRIAAAVALFAALAAGANAADVPQVHVKYGDLNLGTTAGATVLYQRIRGAADAICGVPDTRDLAQMAQAQGMRGAYRCGGGGGGERACAYRGLSEQDG